MRSPLIPLYATAHGATAWGVGLIVAAHMAAAAVGSIPFGRAADTWGRRPLVLGGIAVGVATSALLPLAETVWALILLYGVAGVGIAAFSPSVLSLVGDAAPPKRLGRAFAWYSTAHYGAIGVGPFIGGGVAEAYGYTWSFAGAAAGIAGAFAIGLAIPRRPVIPTAPAPASAWPTVKRNRGVWAGWILAASGLFVQGVVFTFFPLLAHERGHGPGAIGFVFLVLGLANTAARVPAGWLIDRSGRRDPYAHGGLLIAAAATIVFPHAHHFGALLALASVFGAVSGVAFVAVSVGLTAAAPASARGLVMGGYSTALYLGLALGSFATGPIIAREGYVVGFSVGGALGALGLLLAAVVRRGLI
jgi:MFS family permease